MNRRNFIGTALAASAGFFILPGANRLWTPRWVILHEWISPRIGFRLWVTNTDRREVSPHWSDYYTGRTKRISEGQLGHFYKQHYRMLHQAQM